MKYSLGTKAHTSFTGLDSASQLLHAAGFETNVLPAFIKRLLDLIGDVGDLRSWNDIIPAMDEAIETLIKPEAVRLLAVIIQVVDLAAV